jgi:hypothetical protein
MGNLLLVCQELIDVPAVSMEQVLAILDADCHCGEFVCIKKETGKADEKQQISSAYAEL